MANTEMTDLDTKLQQIAINDWPRFAAMIGEDALVSAKVCLLRQNNRSYGEIKVKLSISKEKARYACKQCPS